MFRSFWWMERKWNVRHHVKINQFCYSFWANQRNLSRRITNLSKKNQKNITTIQRVCHPEVSKTFLPCRRESFSCKVRNEKRGYIDEKLIGRAKEWKEFNNRLRRRAKLYWQIKNVGFISKIIKDAQLGIHLSVFCYFV